MSHPRADPPTLRQIYRAMRGAELLLLQDAFILDARATDSPLCRAFCEERLALISAVLKEKAARRRAKVTTGSPRVPTP